jgi:hypothetical protein
MPFKLRVEWFSGHAGQAGRGNGTVALLAESVPLIYISKTMFVVHENNTDFAQLHELRHVTGTVNVSLRGRISQTVRTINPGILFAHLANAITASKNTHWTTLLVPNLLIHGPVKHHRGLITVYKVWHSTSEIAHLNTIISAFIWYSNWRDFISNLRNIYSYKSRSNIHEINCWVSVKPTN